MTDLLRLWLLLLLVTTGAAATVAPQVLTVSTDGAELSFLAAADGRLYQLGFGRRPPAAPAPPPPRTPAREDEAHPPYGNGYILEPALQVAHADGNTSTDLIFAGHDTVAEDDRTTHTRLQLKDAHYPLQVTLHYRAHRAEDVIEQWAEISHAESGPVVLGRFASAAPRFKAASYWLTQFQGNYMREAELVEERLTPGLKVLDSKLGVRAHQMRNPSFLLALDGPAQEESGEVIAGTLAWSGSFQFAFDVDWEGHLRALCGANPFASDYRLAPGRVFTTPTMIWAWSGAGKGPVSRHLHRWARRHALRDGDRPRPVLLNNWEATQMDFDEPKLLALFDGAAEIGAELFLLDDGWFGNRHPRDDDRAGLGDWEVNPRKLPHGLPFLAEQARQRGLGFGIWIEPEMTNPRSVLFEQHPDWVVRQPHRELLFGRHQLVLDLTRPAVRDFVWNVVDRTLGASPAITYTKWDCNRYVTQPGSPHLGAAEQSHLLLDYQWALYDVMRRMAEKYPAVTAMLCSGGSGRADYGALRYFHTFWPSDNTDPLQRITIQWGLGHIFPAAALSAHVTDMGHRPLKLALDVALTGALGVDRDVARWTPAERQQVAAAIQLYKERLRPLVAQGDLYRLQSPYEHPQAALSYVSADRRHAVVFAYRLREAAVGPVKPRGLDPAQRYRVREINLAAGTRSRLGLQDQVVPGATLMDTGFAAPLRRALESAVIELTAEP